MDALLSKLRSIDRHAPQHSAIICELKTRVCPLESTIHTDLEGERMDFIMEDGLEVIGNLIVQDGASSVLILQGLEILSSVAGDSACHWQCIWKALRGLTGINHILESTIHDMEILLGILNLLTQMMSFGFLNVDSAHVFKWIVLWDLVASGMEANHDNSDLLDAFLGLIDSKNLPCPSEMYPRIRLCIERGLAALTGLCDDFNTEQLERGSRLINYFETLPLTKTVDGNSKVSIPTVHIPCAAAA